MTKRESVLVAESVTVNAGIYALMVGFDVGAIVAVGYSEGMHFIDLDEGWWLLDSRSREPFVILVKMERDAFTVRIECCIVVEPGRRNTTRIHHRIPLSVQDFEID